MVNYSYADAWIDYRKRVRLFWLTWLGGFAVVVTLGWLLSSLIESDWLLLALGALWAASFLCVAIRLQYFRCPRCKGRFFFGSWYYWPFARSCVHCALPKWQQ